ncbi:MAG: hypothetical protein NTV54_10240 [Ignavibacteriales bacterium]|nr:hypothetical protein [Ignavibacteriales bacterium]
MSFSTPLARTHLEHALTEGSLRTTIIIRIALMLGIVFFYSAVVLIYALPLHKHSGALNEEALTLLSMVHAVFAAGAVFVALFLSQRVLRKDLLEKACSGKTPEEAAQLIINLHRVSTIVMIVPLEGGAFFGGVICMLAVTQGMMSENPLYWLNAWSAAVLVLAGVLTFPTRERILARLEGAMMGG